MYPRVAFETIRHISAVRQCSYHLGYRKFIKSILYRQFLYPISRGKLSKFKYNNMDSYPTFIIRTEFIRFRSQIQKPVRNR
jgi:hypothetical protein